MPSFAQAFAMPRPIPLAPPVINAVLPFRFSIDGASLNILWFSLAKILQQMNRKCNREK
jgi:hypothetical protein